MSSKIKAILFDMDGVLIDAKEWHYEALNKALGLFGMEISRYDHLVTYDGLPTRRKLEMLTLERGLPAQLHALLDGLKQQYTLEFAYCRCKPAFLHQYALGNLQRMGYRMAVCSNSVRDTISMMMTKADLLRFMEFSVSNQDVKNAKPHPEIYNVAIERMGLKPRECLIIEDNPNGIAAARAAGGAVMEVASTDDVNLSNILRNIQIAEKAVAGA